jgi:hypothetical protein
VKRNVNICFKIHKVVISELYEQKPKLFNIQHKLQVRKFCRNSLRVSNTEIVAKMSSIFCVNPINFDYSEDT